MKYRNLGNTGLRVSEVGFGTWQLADDPGCWVGADIRESLKCLYKFAQTGGNFIDTAFVYGYDINNPHGHPSEELVGKFLKEARLRDKMVVATKIPPKNWTWPAKKGVEISEVFPKKWIETCVDESLASLGVDRIDLMQFHVWQDDFAQADEWKSTIGKITQAGKVRYWGISVNDYEPENCLKTLDTGLIASIQFIFNVFHQEPTKKLIPYAEAHGIGLIARVPLDEGGLSGRFTRETVFAEGDLRKRFFRGERLGQLVDRVDKLKELLDGEAQSIPELDLRYILSSDAVSTVIPGMRKIKHVLANTEISDGRKLSAKMMAELGKHAWERNFYH